MTAGSLPAMPGRPIGQASAAMRAGREADLAKTALEAGALGRAADQADEGEVGAPQRRGRDGEVEGVVMGHHQDEGAGGRGGDLGGRIAGPDRE